MTIKDYINSVSRYISSHLLWDSVVSIIVILLIALVLHLVLSSKLFSEESDGCFSRKNVMYMLRKPAKFMVWSCAFFMILRIPLEHLDKHHEEFCSRAVGISICISLTWFALRLLTNLRNYWYSKPDEIDKTTADAIVKLLKISLYMVCLLSVLDTMEVGLSGVFALAGGAGISLGFAAKDILANFFGAITIHLDRPFSVGDWIRSPDREIEGTVEEIGWRITMIRTFDKRPLYVPNSVFMNISIENASRMLNRRIKENVCIRYDDMSKVKDIMAEIESMLYAHEDIDQNQTIIVNMNSFSDSSLECLIYTFTKTSAWIPFHRVKQDVMLKIADIVEKYGAEFAFPTRSIKVDGLEELSMAKEGR